MVDSKTPDLAYATLYTGKKMPRLGFGTSSLKENATDILSEAIKVGFKHIDTATKYGNEQYIGPALKKNLDDGTVKREDLFIVTKLWHDDKQDPEKAIKTSLEKLQLDYIDLYVIHWPIGGSIDKATGTIKNNIPLHVTWKALEEQVKAGRIKHLGVSNFNVQLLIDLLSYAEVKPVCNQVEIHPYLSQEDLVGFCQKNGIEPVAYFPLGGNRTSTVPLFTAKDIMELPLIKELAAKYNKTPGQIVLNWHLSRGVAPIPRTTSSERMRENFDTLSFRLDEEDVKKMNALNKNIRLSQPRDEETY